MRETNLWLQGTAALLLASKLGMLVFVAVDYALRKQMSGVDQSLELLSSVQRGDGTPQSSSDLSTEAEWAPWLGT